MEKPAFLTKAQREEMRKKQEEEKKKLESQQKEQIKTQIEEFIKKGIFSEFKYWRNTNILIGKEDLREMEKKKREEERNSREKYRSRKYKKSPNRSRSRSHSNERKQNLTQNSNIDSEKVIPMNEKEIENMKKRYLGLNKEHKKIQKPSEKFHTNFVFDWDESEDTSRDISSFYEKRLDPHLLFGKGRIGGVDYNIQKESYEAAISKNNGKQNEEDKNEHDNKLLGKDREETKHWSKKSLEEMTMRDWRIFREDNDISLKGSKAPLPIRNWKESNLPDYILRAINRMGYSQPTEIQMQGIPAGLERKDMIGIAPTGSGKSCAYLVPFIICLSNMPPLDAKNFDDGPRGLILTPTRELAIQVDEDFKKLAHYTKLTSACVVGGRSAEEQSFTLSRGADVLIGTPGRIVEFLEKRFIVLNQCFYTILDEGDTMIDLGFEQDVNKILSTIPVSPKGNTEEEVEIQIQEMKENKKLYRITHMFSATMPPALEKLAKMYMKFPIIVQIGRPGTGKKEIEQRIELLSEYGKKQRIISILEDSQPPIMVFVNQKKDIDNLARYISSMTHMRCATLHSDKTQEKRERALAGFKSGSYDVLICTNLASRGLDVEGVTHVINYDAPTSIADYTHRIGRTGRAKKKGIATTFLTNSDSGIFYDLRNYLTESKQKIPQEFADHPASYTKPMPKLEGEQKKEDQNERFDQNNEEDEKPDFM